MCGLLLWLDRQIINTINRIYCERRLHVFVLQFIHKSPLYSAFFMRQNDQLKITKSIGLRARSESVGRLLLRATNGNIDTKQVCAGMLAFICTLHTLPQNSLRLGTDMLQGVP